MNFPSFIFHFGFYRKANLRKRDDLWRENFRPSEVSRGGGGKLFQFLLKFLKFVI